MSNVKCSLTSCYPGQQLGNYRLIRLLGQGGFADVYLGKHIYLDTPAAVKILHTRHGQIGVDMQAFFDIDLLTVAALGGVLAGLGVAPFLLELLVALCLVLLPLGGALIRGDTPLFFLTASGLQPAASYAISMAVVRRLRLVECGFIQHVPCNCSFVASYIVTQRRQYFAIERTGMCSCYGSHVRK